MPQAARFGRLTGAEERQVLIVDDLLLGVLASAFVAYADRLDGEAETRASKRAARLREAAQTLRSPTETARDLLNESFQEHTRAGAGSPIARLAEAIGGDPLWSEQLARWMLESDPARVEAKRKDLVDQLSTGVGCPAEEVDAFLRRVYQRVTAHPVLGPLRADDKLSSVLASLGELVNLQEVVRQHHVHLAAHLQLLLDQDRVRCLVPVCPQFRPVSENNGLLHGQRPTDEDMHQGLDFRRTRFPEVLEAVTEVESLPAALVFLADPHRGKTTFLKRVGWELARQGYPVVQLEAGFRAEPYAPWLLEAAAEAPRPLVALIDDPLTDREHFQSQMTMLSDRQASVLCLIASRYSDWNNIEVKRVPLLSRARSFVLDPNALEGQKVLEKLIEQGVVHIDRSRIPHVLEEIAREPVSDEYFHRVIEIASEQRFKPTPVLVEERLAEAAGSAEALAFERIYGFVCLFGMVGLSLPQKAAQRLMPEAERWQARELSNSIANPPIRWEDDSLTTTHEMHAAAFFKEHEVGHVLREYLDSTLVQPDLRDSAGLLLELFRQRAHGKLALEAWTRIAPQVAGDYWKPCSAVALQVWGSYFFHNQLPELALQVCEEALRSLLAPERASDREELALAEQVAKALYNKGVRLGALDRSEEALEVYDQVEARYGDREELALAEQVAKALNNKGVSLGALDRSEEELEVYDQVEARYGDREELALAEQVAKALYNKSARQLTMSARMIAGSKAQEKTWLEAESTLREFAGRTGRPLDRVYNYACLLALRTQTSRALRALEECFKVGSITVAHVRRDSDWKSFRSLPEFSTLLDRYGSSSH